MSKKSIKFPFKLRKKSFFASFLGFGVIVLGGAAILPSIKPVEASGESRVFTIYDQGERISFKTNAETVREALKQKDISLYSNDNVEPSLDEKLAGAEYSVNIYRAIPVVIQDGNHRFKIMTSSKTAEKIAHDGKVKLYPEDRISIETSQNLIEDGASTFLMIHRAKLISVNLFGAEQQMRTQSETVEQFLAEKSIKLGEKDGVSRNLSDKINEGDHIQIWRDGKQTISVEEEINFETEKIQDGEKDSSYKMIKEAGEKGKKTVVYEIEMKGGKEVSRTKINEVETKKPKKQIEVVGTKTASPFYTGGGTKDQWLAESGIPQQYWGYVDAIIQKESRWNPNATNSSSGACGLAQALPCSKVSGKGGYDPVSALQWANSYVNGRYYDGSPYAKGACGGADRGWECAWRHWQKYRWY